MIARSRESSRSGTTLGTSARLNWSSATSQRPIPSDSTFTTDVRSKLVAAGIPHREIAFIHDAETDTAKKVLFDAVNAGRVRILLGSTEKMGAGTNVQRRLVALHHLDAPWRPRDIEQREGRILRQGNTNKEVQIYRYVTEGSFDAYMWQTLETKARFIQQVMRGETSVRSAEDLDSGALTYAEIKAIASGNPAVVEKIKIDTEIRKLDQLRAVHANQQRHIRWEIRDLPRQIAETKQRLAEIEADIAAQERQRLRGVHHDGRQSGFLRQGSARGSCQGSDLHDPLVARRSDDAAARAVSRLRDSEQGQEAADSGSFKRTSVSRNCSSAAEPRIPRT